MPTSSLAIDHSIQTTFPGYLFLWMEQNQECGIENWSSKQPDPHCCGWRRWPSLFRRNWLAPLKLDWGDLHGQMPSSWGLADSSQDTLEDGLGTMQGYEAKLHVDPEAGQNFVRLDWWHTLRQCMPCTQKECDWDDQNMVEVTQIFYSAGTMATAQSAYCMGSSSFLYKSL